MKANVIVADLNPCGGAERLSLVTMQALSEMEIDFDLTTLKSPDVSRLENAYGKNLVSVMKNIEKVNVIDIIEELKVQFLQEQRQQQQYQSNHYYDYDITINTHPDSAPYFHPSFSKNNAVTYCHYPAAKYHIESENIGYLEKDLEIEMTSNIVSYDDHNNNKDNTIGDSKNYIKTDNICKLSETTIKQYFRILKYGYWNLMRNSTIITNSEFTRRAILSAFGADYNNNIHILSPPIDFDIFRNNIELMTKRNYGDGDYYKRHDTVIVISRIAAHKEIENAIKLAKILKVRNIGKGMVIVGNLYNYFEYYAHLKQMVIDLGLIDFVAFEINGSLDKLLAIMGTSKVCFSPRPEPFGMAVLEAMAAGLVPIVPSVSGSAEFVPQQYWYSTLEQAAEIISSAFHLPNQERIQISNGVSKFSNFHYIDGFKRLLNEIIDERRK
jgi:glycosyltransferase involved in cell wall biosynthesis